MGLDRLMAATLAGIPVFMVLVTFVAVTAAVILLGRSARVR